MELPAALRAALDRELEGVARGPLAERAARASAAYRSGAPSAGVIREAADALAYALTRLPATYAACMRALAQARARAPGFAPRTLLDAGTGTAAASWAAFQAWPSMEAVYWLDSNPAFLTTAARLAADGPPPLRAAQLLRDDLSSARALPAADLVMASYVLAELRAARLRDALDRLWRACEGVLVLVEPGTPAGHRRIVAAREFLAATGAEILAPCAHAAACPIAAPDWCHFAVRLPRGRDHRLAKAAEASFEDEKFAYLAAARPGLAAATAPWRVLAQPRAGKVGVELKLCTPDGLAARLIPRRDKASHARARRLGWGDGFEP